jgi:hypothetical protein
MIDGIWLNVTEDIAVLYMITSMLGYPTHQRIVDCRSDTKPINARSNDNCVDEQTINDLGRQFLHIPK